MSSYYFELLKVYPDRPGHEVTTQAERTEAVLVIRVTASEQDQSRRAAVGGENVASNARAARSRVKSAASASSLRRADTAPQGIVCRPDNTGFPVVGLGASAGGLEAVRKLLAALPADSGCAFVLIQHLDPSHKSRLVELLARDTAMQVLQAGNGMSIERNCLYIIPPEADLSLRDGVFQLSQRAAVRSGARLPFDFFLHSLADEYGERAVCVILSGTGADGSAGIRSVRKNGGLVIAQEPRDSAYPGMPQSAIATGAVDWVLPAAKIPHALRVHAQHPYLAAERRLAPQDDLSDASLTTIIDLLRPRASPDFAHYKRATVVRRIRRRMAAAGVKEVDDYIKTLRTDVSELERLAKELLIHLTRFFRDPAACASLAKTVIPELVRQRATEEPIRIWIPGCSTGEEAYSIAMLFVEELAATQRNEKLQVFASDVSREAVAFSRAGLFSESIKAHVSAKRLARFFTRENQGYRVCGELRELVVFTVHDLLADPPFSRLDFISCRNLLIYLQPEEQEKVLSLFHRVLREDGILFLGASEDIGKLADRFAPVPHTVRAFRRMGSSELQEQPLVSNLGGLVRSRWPHAVAQIEPKRPDLDDLARRLLLEDYAPAAVLVNSTYQALYFFGPTDRYLRAVGEPGQLLPAMLRTGLATHFRAAVRRASRGQATVSVHGARIKRSSGYVTVAISARLVEHEGQELLLVTFIDEPEHRTPGPGGSPAEGIGFPQFEQRLETTRRELERTTHQLIASSQQVAELNEERVSLNEEFQSTNEELETSREELQSLNEELTTANSQLQDSLERQRNTSADLQNILNSSQIATLFLDRDLRVRFFTPAGAPLFNLIATDLGRPLSDLAWRFREVDLLADARTVLGSLTPVQREIKVGAATWYLSSISPYRTQDDRIDGVVINLADVSTFKTGEEKLRSAQAYTNAVIDTIHEPLVVLDRELRVQGASESFYALFGGRAEDSFGRPILSVAAQLDTPTSCAFLENTKTTNESPESREITLDVPPLGERKLLATARTIRGAAASDERILVSFSDVTDLKRAAQDLATQHAAELAHLAKSRFLAAASHDLRQPLQTLSLLQGALRQEIRDTLSLAVLSKAENALGALSGTLNALLDINQIEAGVIRPKLTDVAINEMLGVLQSEFADYATHKGLRWRVVSCRLTVRSDRHLFEQMLRNLLSNAIRHTDSGTILVGCRRAGDKLRIEVWDTGAGIAADEIPHLFDEYPRATNPPPQGSLGLGLAIVQHLGDALGHPVRVRSQVGKGSVFSIELPVVAPIRDPIHRSKDPHDLGRNQPAEARVDASSATIHVVDNDRGAREAMQIFLMQAGYSVKTYASAASFLNSYRPGKKGCLITDVYMPGMNGFELLAVLAAAGHALPAIVVTGQGDVSMAVRAMRAGAVDFIEKPTDPDALLGCIDRALRQAVSPEERSSRYTAAAMRMAGLTKRQREVMDFVVAGLANKDIATRLGISRRTVETYRATVMKKVGASSLTELIRFELAARAEDLPS